MSTATLILGPPGAGKSTSLRNLDPAQTLLIQTIRKVKAGEELTYDYDIRIEPPITAEERRLWACHCGAPNCTGTMIKPAKKKKRAAQPA